MYTVDFFSPYILVSMKYFISIEQIQCLLDINYVYIDINRMYIGTTCMHAHVHVYGRYVPAIAYLCSRYPVDTDCIYMYMCVLYLHIYVCEYRLSICVYMHIYSTRTHTYIYAVDTSASYLSMSHNNTRIYSSCLPCTSQIYSAIYIHVCKYIIYVNVFRYIYRHVLVLYACG